MGKDKRQKIRPAKGLGNNKTNYTDPGGKVA